MFTLERLSMFGSSTSLLQLWLLPQSKDLHICLIGTLVWGANEGCDILAICLGCGSAHLSPPPPSSFGTAVIGSTLLYVMFVGGEAVLLAEPMQEV